MYTYLVFLFEWHKKGLNNFIVVYTDIKSETTVIQIYSSEMNAFAEKSIKHGSVRTLGNASRSYMSR